MNIIGFVLKIRNFQLCWESPEITRLWCINHLCKLSGIFLTLKTWIVQYLFTNWINSLSASKEKWIFLYTTVTKFGALLIMNKLTFAQTTYTNLDFVCWNNIFVFLPKCQCIILSSKASYVGRSQWNVSTFQMDGMCGTCRQTWCVL